LTSCESTRKRRSSKTPLQLVVLEHAAVFYIANQVVTFEKMCKHEEQPQHQIVDESNLMLQHQIVVESRTL